MYLFVVDSIFVLFINSQILQLNSNNCPLLPTFLCVSYFYANEGGRYEYPRKMGMMKVFPSPSKFTAKNIFDRIHTNQAVYQAKFERKAKLEQEFYDEKYSRDKQAQ